MAWALWVFGLALVFYSLVVGAWGVAIAVGLVVWWTRPRRYA